MDAKLLIEFAKTLDGEELKTVRRGAAFKVEVRGEDLIFKVRSSNKPELERFPNIERFCARYEEKHGSELTTDYDKERDFTISYMIALARAFKERHGTRSYAKASAPLGIPVVATRVVIPAQAGIQRARRSSRRPSLDSRVRGNDDASAAQGISGSGIASSTCDVRSEQNLTPAREQSTNKDNSFQRIGAPSNTDVGSKFEKVAMEYFAQQGIALSPNFGLPIGTREKKEHRFDLGASTPQKIIVECKSHRWTRGDNMPSAKMAVWNEAMLYFLLAPNDYRKIMFVLHDKKRGDGESLLDYYIRTHSHLIPDGVEFLEYDETTGKVARLRPRI